MAAPRALAMADTYAVVQKRGAPAVTRSGSGARGAEEAPLYSQVTPRAHRPQAPAEDVRGTLPGRGESGRPRERGWEGRPPPAGPPPRRPPAGHARKCSGPHLRPGVWAGICDLAAPPGAVPPAGPGPARQLLQPWRWSPL